MEIISSMSKFLELLHEDVKTNKPSYYTITNYSDRPEKTFTILKVYLDERGFLKKYQRVGKLEITNQTNRFAFILDEIKKAFTNQHRISLQYDLYANILFYVTINNVKICLDFMCSGNEQRWKLNTAKELTKPIAFSSFLEMLLDAVKNNKSFSYNICNYDKCIYRYDHELDGNIFSASGTYDNLPGDCVYLEIPQVNKYDFIFDEIRKTFPNHTLFAVSSRVIRISINKNSKIYLIFDVYDWENWTFEKINELGLK